MTRTKTFSMFKRLLPLPLLALASLARAGHWEVTYSGGSASGDHPKQYAWDGSNYSAAGVNVYGTVVATFKWTPDYPGDSSAPLDHAYVLETCSASGANDNSNNPHFNAPAADADNGLRSGTVRQANHPYGNSSGYVVYTATSRGTRVTYHNIGNTREFQVSCSPTAQGGMNYGSAVVTYRAEVTEYAVSISSDRDESFHKGPGGLPESNLNDVLTPRFGDTAIDSYRIMTDQNGYPTLTYYYVLPTFTRELIGGWVDPFHQWNVDGTSFTDSAVSEWDSVSKEWDYSSEEVKGLASGPASKVVTLRATQDGGNGGSANATYTLRIHNQYENWRMNKMLDPIYEEVSGFTIDNPGYAQSGGGIGCHWMNNGAEWAAMQTAASALSSVAGNMVSNPFFAGGFAAAGIGVAELGPKPDNGVAPWAWHWNGSTISGGDWNDDQQAYDMVPSFEQGYDLMLQDVDQYGVHGYTGIAHDIKAKPNAHRRWTGAFTRRAGSGWPSQ